MIKTILASLTILTLTACQTVPVERKFPNVLPTMIEPCDDLAILSTNAQLSEVVEVVTSNYGQYQTCQVKVEAWITWYKKQKEIFEGVK